MSYKLEHPYTEEQRANFIVEYNHNRSLTIEETEQALFALEKDEIMQEGEPIKNPNYEEEQAKKEAERIGKLECTKRVFVLMLEQLGIGYFDKIEPLIKSNPQAQLEWELCVKLERSNPLLDIMASQLGVTPEQLDGLFKCANGEITIDEFKELIPENTTPEEGSETNSGDGVEGEVE